VDGHNCANSISKTIDVYPLPVASFSNTPACLGDTTYFYDGSTPSDSITIWSWDFGDNSFSTVKDPWHQYGASGPYNVTLIIADTNGCRDTISNIIVVDSLPIAQFIADTVCLNNPTAFTDLSISQGSANSSWQWDFGDGSPLNNTQHPTHTYTASGVYTVTLTVANSNGCSHTYIKDILVYPLPVVDFSYSLECLGDSTDFTGQSGGGVKITSWSWDFGDGSPVNHTQNPTHLYNTSGTYTVTLSVVDGHNCANSISKTIDVYPLPVASFSNTPACLGDTTYFYDGSTPSDSITIWSWDFGDNNFSTVKDPWHQYGASGPYNVTLIIADTNGCRDTISSIIVVDSLPIAQFIADTVCLNNPTAFTDLSISQGSANSSWQWDFGDGSPLNNTQHPTHTYTASGVYTVTLTVANSNGCSHTYIKDILVYPLPVVDFSYSLECLGDSTDFTGQSGGGVKITSWSWDFGDGSPVNHTQNPTHLYNSSGTYTVTLSVVDGHNCANSISKTIDVYPLPVASFSNTPACLGDTTYFYDGSTPSDSITIWSWDFGDNSFSTVKDPGINMELLVLIMSH
jgi:PKD repeat protein